MLDVYPLMLAAAAGNGEPSLFDGTLYQAIAAIIAFSLVAALLGKYAWPQIIDGLQAREDKLKHDLEHAEAQRREADALHEQRKAELAEAGRKAQATVDEARKSAEAVAARIKADAEADITRSKQRAKQEIEASKEQALAEIYDNVAELSTQIAGQILQRELNPEDQRGLIDQSLAQLDLSRN